MRALTTHGRTTRKTSRRSGTSPASAQAAEQVTSRPPAGEHALSSARSGRSRVPSASYDRSWLSAAPRQRRWQQRTDSLVAAVATAAARTAPRDGEFARLLLLAAAVRIGRAAGREGTAFGIGRTRVCTAHARGFPRRGWYHVTISPYIT